MVLDSLTIGGMILVALFIVALVIGPRIDKPGK